MYAPPSLSYVFSGGQTFDLGYWHHSFSSMKKSLGLCAQSPASVTMKPNGHLLLSPGDVCAIPMVLHFCVSPVKWRHQALLLLEGNELMVCGAWSEFRQVCSYCVGVCVLFMYHTQWDLFEFRTSEHCWPGRWSTAKLESVSCERDLEVNFLLSSSGKLSGMLGACAQLLDLGLSSKTGFSTSPWLWGPSLQRSHQVCM